MVWNGIAQQLIYMSIAPHKFYGNVLHLFNLQDVLPCHLNAKLSNEMEKGKKCQKSKNTNNSNIESLSLSAICVTCGAEMNGMRSSYPIRHPHTSVYICIKDLVSFHPHFAHFWHFGIFISFLIVFFPLQQLLFFFLLAFELSSTQIFVCMQPMERKKRRENM